MQTWIEMLACRAPPRVVKGHSQTPNAMRAQQTMRIADYPHYLLVLRQRKTEAEASAWIKEPMPSLQKAGFRERVRCAQADDDVIQHLHVDQCQCSLQVLGQRAIRVRRFGGTRGMLVREDDRGGV